MADRLINVVPDYLCDFFDMEGVDTNLLAVIERNDGIIEPSFDDQNGLDTGIVAKQILPHFQGNQYVVLATLGIRVHQMQYYFAIVEDGTPETFKPYNFGKLFTLQGTNVEQLIKVELLQVYSRESSEQKLRYIVKNSR